MNAVKTQITEYVITLTLSAVEAKLLHEVAMLDSTVSKVVTDCDRFANRGALQAFLHKLNVTLVNADKPIK